MQARLLALMRDGRVWGREELAERLADETQLGAPALAGTVSEAVDALIEAGLAHRILGEELVAASWRGMRGSAADAPDDAGGLQVSQDASGAGVLEAVNDPDRFRGGAEGLSGRLEPVSACD
jgi:hypothetical protein